MTRSTANTLHDKKISSFFYRETSVWFDPTPVCHFRIANRVETKYGRAAFKPQNRFHATNRHIPLVIPKTSAYECIQTHGFGMSIPLIGDSITH